MKIGSYMRIRRKMTGCKKHNWENSGDVEIPQFQHTAGYSLYQCKKCKKVRIMPKSDSPKRELI